MSDRKSVVVYLSAISFSAVARLGFRRLHKPGQDELTAILRRAAHCIRPLPRQPIFLLPDAIVDCAGSYTTYTFLGDFLKAVFVYVHSERLLRIISIEPRGSERGPGTVAPVSGPRVDLCAVIAVSTATVHRWTSNAGGIPSMTERDEFFEAVLNLMNDEDRALFAPPATDRALCMSKNVARTVGGKALDVHWAVLDGGHSRHRLQHVLGLLDAHRSDISLAGAVRDLFVVHELRRVERPSAVWRLAFITAAGRGGPTRVLGVGASFPVGPDASAMALIPLGAGARHQYAMHTLTSVMLMEGKGVDAHDEHELSIVLPRASTAMFLGDDDEPAPDMHWLRQRAGVGVKTMPADRASALIETLGGAHFSSLWFDTWSINAMSMICEDLGKMAGSRWDWKVTKEDTDELRFASRSCRMPPVAFDVSRLRVAFNVI
ncbi:hypothetical protein EON82_20420, partial [bacterium]